MEGDGSEIRKDSQNEEAKTDEIYVGGGTKGHWGATV